MFKTFPEFSKPTIADKDAYNELIKDYPPYVDLTFAMLMTWWNTLDSLAIAELNGNLVISYWLPGDEEHSGLALVGTTKIDESINAIFEHQRKHGSAPRLVHVPEFVIRSLRHPKLFKYTEEREYDENVLALDKLGEQFQKQGLQMNEAATIVAAKKLEVKDLDLALASTRHELLEVTMRWRSRGEVNYTLELLDHVVPVIITQGDALGMKSLGLYVDGRLQAYLLYQRPHDTRYAIVNMLQMNAGAKGLYEVLVFKFAEWFGEQGVQFVNLDADLGLSFLREMRLGLGTIEFLRKFTVEPK
jgi:hypothetical protein